MLAGDLFVNESKRFSAVDGLYKFDPPTLGVNQEPAMVFQSRLWFFCVGSLGPC